MKLPLNPDGQLLNIVRLAHANNLGSWGGRKRHGCSKRVGVLLKGMEQQLYGSKGEAPGLRDTNFILHFYSHLCDTTRLGAWR